VAFVVMDAARKNLRICSSAMMTTGVANRNRGSILLVDDDPTLRKEVTLHLGALGFEVYEAGADAYLGKPYTAESLAVEVIRLLHGVVVEYADLSLKPA